jgi:CHASE3 domain sensor protein
MDAIPNYGWPAVLVAVLGILGTVIGAVIAGRKRKRERTDEVEQEREADAAAGDLDLEHLDRERIERLRK